METFNFSCTSQQTDRKHQEDVTINQNLALRLANYDFRKSLLRGHGKTHRTVHALRSRPDNKSCCKRMQQPLRAKMTPLIPLGKEIAKSASFLSP